MKALLIITKIERNPQIIQTIFILFISGWLVFPENPLQPDIGSTSEIFCEHFLLGLIHLDLHNPSITIRWFVKIKCKPLLLLSVKESRTSRRWELKVMMIKGVEIQIVWRGRRRPFMEFKLQKRQKGCKFSPNGYCSFPVWYSSLWVVVVT
jgi:hypothetical protein